MKPCGNRNAQLTHRQPVKVIDATRVSDGATVVLKPVVPGGTELHITKYLSSVKDADNHAVPLLDDFPDEKDETKHYIVTPLLRDFDQPAFHSVDEIIEFIDQTLKVRESLRIS